MDMVGTQSYRVLERVGKDLVAISVVLLIGVVLLVAESMMLLVHCGYMCFTWKAIPKHQRTAHLHNHEKMNRAKEIYVGNANRFNVCMLALKTQSPSKAG